MRQLVVAWIGAGILALTLSGCSHDNNPGTSPAVPPMTQAQVQAIENNPKVSPQTKAATLAESQSAQSSGRTTSTP